GRGAYLRAGSAVAGGPLARDVGYLTEIGDRDAVPTPVLSSVRLSNEAHQAWPRRRLREVFGGDLRGKTIAVLGLAYKAGTDTLRRSSAIETCRWLSGEGASVAAHDRVIRQLPSEL